MSKLQPSLLRCFLYLLSLIKAPCRDLARVAPLELGAQRYHLFQPKADHDHTFVVLKSQLTGTPTRPIPLAHVRIDHLTSTLYLAFDASGYSLGSTFAAHAPPAPYIRYHHSLLRLSVFCIYSPSPFPAITLLLFTASSVQLESC